MDRKRLLLDTLVAVVALAGATAGCHRPLPPFVTPPTVTPADGPATAAHPPKAPAPPSSARP